jgi:uncharacterized protein (TIGR02646 family)
VIHVPRPAASPLTPEKVKAELKAREDFYANPANADKSFAFKLYNSAPVKKALTELFGNKCAYCESLLPTQPPDVEHFRPKAAVLDNGSLVDGYWWLAAEWTNLLPSCIDCNRSRYQDFPGAPAHLSGKANQFPLAPGSARAKAPGQEAAEQALLLDPCRDAAPEAHLEFFEKDGFSLVRPALDAAGVESPRGRASMDVYGLLRKTLVDARSDRLKSLRFVRKSLERALRDLAADPADPEAQAEAQEARDEVKRLIDASSPYAGLARRYFASGGG